MLQLESLWARKMNHTVLFLWMSRVYTFKKNCNNSCYFRREIRWRRIKRAIFWDNILIFETSNVQQFIQWLVLPITSTFIRNLWGDVNCQTLSAQCDSIDNFRWGKNWKTVTTWQFKLKHLHSYSSLLLSIRNPAEQSVKLYFFWNFLHHETSWKKLKTRRKWKKTFYSWIPQFRELAP